MESIFNKIDNSKILDYEDSFDIANQCAKLLFSDSSADQSEVRRVVIHVLDNWGKVCKDTYPLWADIIESLGFYPYIEKTRRIFHLVLLLTILGENTISLNFWAIHTYIKNKKGSLIIFCREKMLSLVLLQALAKAY